MDSYERTCIVFVYGGEYMRVCNIHSLSYILIDMGERIYAFNSQRVNGTCSYIRLLNIVSSLQSIYPCKDFILERKKEHIA